MTALRREEEEVRGTVYTLPCKEARILFKEKLTCSTRVYSSASPSSRMATLALEELRREARKLESTIDLKLVSYSKFGANLAHASFLREEDRGLSTEPDGAGKTNNAS